jgi:hypothetical protein
MTRINVGISPKNLTDQHLLAEHREIARMRSSFLRWYNSKKRSEIPSKFCLGEGHVLFFIDKGLYTKNVCVEDSTSLIIQVVGIVIVKNTLIVTELPVQINYLSNNE